MTAKRIISYPYMILRAATAGATLGAGLLQTFVFARVLAPERFSLFIFVAALGYSLYLADAGVVKVLFVTLRRRFLQDKPLGMIAGQATVLFVLYCALTALAAAICFLILVAYFNYSTIESAELTLFFLFNAINLPWFALRNISIAIDEYFHFETLEASRRGLNTIALVALLLGLPVMAFLVIINAGWVAAIVAAIAKLRRRRAFGGALRRNLVYLLAFFRANGRQLFSSTVHAISETYIYNFPYFLVPWAYGLGAPTIIFDTAYKIFRGNQMIYGATTDLFVPRQTRAFNDRDAPTLIRATLLALAVSAVPLICIVSVLAVVHDRFFTFLLGSAAVMPPEIVPVLVIMLSVNLVKLVAYSLLVHCGFFAQVARLGPLFIVAMTGTSFLAIWLKLDIVGFMALNAAGYTIGTIFAFITMMRGPIRVAGQHDAVAVARGTASR